MISRAVSPVLEQALKKYPVAALLGPRQSGKTTLARTVAASRGNAVYLDLELPSDANRLSNAESYLESVREKMVVLDEVQRMPELFPLLRALVDRHRVPGRFLLLGSASPHLVKHASESLAGRIRTLELTPFTLAELEAEQMSRLWLRGGYPRSFLAADDAESMDWRLAFIATHLERDIPQLGIRIPAGHLRRFWTMLAHLHGEQWNASRIASSMEFSAPTINRYLDILEDTFMVRQVRPYRVNIGKRLVKSSKVYLRDTGLLHALLGLQSADDLASHPSLGASWEGFVVEQIAAALPDGWQLFYYRTAAGAEIDLVILDRKQRLTAVEVKYSSAPKSRKGFTVACEDLKIDRRFIVYPGKERYLLNSLVTVIPVHEAGSLFT